MFVPHTSTFGHRLYSLHFCHTGFILAKAIESKLSGKENFWDTTHEGVLYCLARASSLPWPFFGLISKSRTSTQKTMPSHPIIFQSYPSFCFQLKYHFFKGDFGQLCQALSVSHSVALYFIISSSFD